MNINNKISFFVSEVLLGIGFGAIGLNLTIYLQIKRMGERGIYDQLG